MNNLIKNIYTPILSLFLFAIGSGLLNTLLVFKLNSNGEGSIAIGAMTSFYYLGLVFGSFKIEKIIIRTGHIRTFSTFAAILTAAVLTHSLTYDLYLWLCLRVISGFATAGLFIVIESWLLTVGSNKNRGTMLSIYMVSLYLAQVLGQLLLKFNSPDSSALFIAIGITSVLSIIPLSLTKIQSPILEEASALSLKKIFSLTKTGVVGCFCGGLILSSIYGLFPLYLIQTTSSDFVITGMSVVILGGMFWQYPIGKISDKIERRKVLIFLSIGTAICSLLLIFAIQSIALACFLIFILGGLSFTIYPISISHACDSLKANEITSGTQALLLAYSLGAVMGPLISPIFMSLIGPNGFFVYMILISSFLIYYTFWRQSVTDTIEPDEPFITMPTTSPLISTLDPRGD